MSGSAPLALISAFLFALGVHFSRFGLRTMSSRDAAIVQMGSSAAVYWLFAPLFVDTWFWLTSATVIYIVIGFLRPFLSSNLALAGTKRLGPTVSSTLGSTSPMFGVALGILALGEPLSWPVWVGAIGIMVGVMVLSTRNRNDPLPRSFPLWALLLPVGAAALRAIAQMMTKVGMEIVASPFFVGLVGYTVGFAIAFMVEGRMAGTTRAVKSTGSRWLILTGVTNAISVLILNYALADGRLSVVSPLVACSPVFTLLLGWLVFRERELTGRSVVAVGIVVPSVILIGWAA